MKKLLSLILAVLISVSIICVPVYASTGHINPGDTPEFNGATSNNAFGDLLDWTGIVFSDANNLIDTEGTLAVGGSFNSTTGLSLNGGAYGANPASTEDVAFLVNGNINIRGYGNIWGQTVAGNSEGNTYHLTNVTLSGTTNGQFAVADSAKYFADASSTAYAVKNAVEALPVNGECEEANGTYTFKGNSDADTLVYNVADSNINSYLFDFTIADGQTIIVNLTASEKINLKYGAYKINGKMEADYLRKYNRNIIINVVNSPEIEMTSCELYGILLAPDTGLSGRNASVCGTSIVKSLTGSGGFELHVGSDNSFIPAISSSTPEPAAGGSGGEGSSDTVGIRIDVPKKMAVAFEDGTIYYGGEMKEVVVGKEYPFQMCAVNWDNGMYDENGNGLRGTVVYRMKVVHQNEFNELARAAKENPDRYTVKGIDIIDNEAKTIIVNCDAKDTHLETDVNNFFIAYRFHFEGSDYKKMTGIDNVVNNPLESLSVNLPAGSTITCNAYDVDGKIDSDDVFITRNSGEGIYDDVFLTSVNDYTWHH